MLSVALLLLLLPLRMPAGHMRSRGMPSECLQECTELPCREIKST
jgi:hypothetical protein